MNDKETERWLKKKEYAKQYYKKNRIKLIEKNKEYYRQHTSVKQKEQQGFRITKGSFLVVFE